MSPEIFWEQSVKPGAGHCDVTHHGGFVMDPEDDPLEAKQETIMVPPPHPLNSLLLVPYIRHQGVTVKSALSNIYFGTEKQALADIHQTAKVLSVR